MTRSVVAILAAVLLGVPVVGGCSTGPAAPPPGAEQPHAHLPNAPDHTHATDETRAPDETGAPVETREADGRGSVAEWNHDDVSYVQMMIPHHGQALALAELAETRAGHAGVRAAADRIEAAQGPEVLEMAGWLAERRIDVPSPDEDPHDYDHGAHGHNPMVGLLTDEETGALAAARGAEFDRLFLAGMVRHHAGAVEMADDLLATGADPQVSEMAADVRAGLVAEIGRMRALLAVLD